MKIFVDDLRDPPDSTWTVVRDGNQAIELINKHLISGKFIQAISFDHDLGDDQPTGYDIVKHFEVRYGRKFYRIPDDQKYAVTRRWPDEVTIHSANPVGRVNMINALSKISEYSDNSLWSFSNDPDEHADHY